MKPTKNTGRDKVHAGRFEGCFGEPVGVFFVIAPPAYRDMVLMRWRYAFTAALISVMFASPNRSR